MGPEGNILVISLITTFQQSLTHSALGWSVCKNNSKYCRDGAHQISGSHECYHHGAPPKVILWNTFFQSFYSDLSGATARRSMISVCWPTDWSDRRLGCHSWGLRSQLSPAKWNPTTLQMWSSCSATEASRATMASTFVDLQGPTSSLKLSAE